MRSTWIHTNKKSLLQISGMLLGYLITRKMLFAGLASAFFLILIFFPQISLRVTKVLDHILSAAGKLIKRLLFFMMFVLVMIPISLMMGIFSKKKKTTTTAYTERVSSYYDLKKMW